MKIITFFLCLSAFFILRPYLFMATGLMYPGDDWSYFAHASSLAFGQFPSYAKEFWMSGQNVPFHSVGSGILAAPFVFVFSVLDRLAGSDIVAQRTAANIPSSWAVFGFIVASVFYFWAGCALLFHALIRFVSKNTAAWAVVLMVIAEGAPLFVFRRPVFSHVYSFAVLAFLVFLSVKAVKEKNLSWKWTLAAGAACGLTMLIRTNNFFLGFFWPVILAFLGLEGESLRNKWPRILTMWAVAAVLVLIFKVWPEMIAGSSDLAKGASSLLIVHSPIMYLKRLVHVLFGIDWGLVYTAPFLLTGVIYLYGSRRPDLKLFRWLCPLLLVNLWVVIQWMTQGGWYGYRYLIFSGFAIGILPFALFIENISSKRGRWSRLFLSLIAIVPALSMLCFEGNSNLTLHHGALAFGDIGWGNDTYQLEVWKTLIFHPATFVEVVLKGIPLYLIYLLWFFIPNSSAIPAQVVLKYPVFDVVVFVKTVVILFLPAVLTVIYYCCIKRKTRGSKICRS